MTDAVKAKVWEIETKPFGDNATITGTVALNLRFPGQYYDAETGLNYNYYRDYNPSIGRYIQKDPIGLHGGINLFAYTQNNSINATDYYGLCAWDLCCGEVAIAGAIASGILYYGAPIAADIGKWLGNVIESRIDDPAADKEYNDYKDRYREPPPPNLDPCEMLKWKLRKEERLFQDRKNWDAKWKPGAHCKSYEQSENAIKNLKNKIKNVCKEPCKKN